jgi:hypothetical protein
LLLSIQPADQRGEKHPQEEHINHGGRVYLIDQFPEAGALSYQTLLRSGTWFASSPFTMKTT